MIGPLDHPGRFGVLGFSRVPARRNQACDLRGVSGSAHRAEVEASTEVYDGDDLAEYVIACNVTRRNMSTGARAMATALVLLADGHRENGRWRYGAVTAEINESVKSAAAFRQRLNECGIVLDFLPDLAEQVTAGTLALNAAFEQADAIRTSAERDKILARERRKREKAEAAAEAEFNAQIVADLALICSAIRPPCCPAFVPREPGASAASAGDRPGSRAAGAALDFIERYSATTHVRVDRTPFEPVVPKDVVRLWGGNSVLSPYKRPRMLADACGRVNVK